MKLTLTIKNENDVNLQLKQGSRVVANESLTPSQEFDTLLIRTIDKLLARNRIDRLSLKSLVIRGKLRVGAVSSMTLETLKSALEV